MSRIKLGLVGVGKIARDQHLPVLANFPAFELLATASRNASVEGVRAYRNLADMLEAEPDIEAVSLCTPPGPRDDDARLALDRGLHVLLEKPPGVTPGAVRDLAERARKSVLVASWHSRHAPAVETARAWLDGRRLIRGEINWREDIRVWHPGQDWILDAGGMGVFDPGSNALSFLTSLVPERISVERADLGIPANRQSPLTARLALKTGRGAPISATFDFLQTGAQTWDICLVSDAGELILHEGGARLAINGVEQAIASEPHHEYKGVYANFAACVRGAIPDCDLRPLEIVADAFMLGRRTALAAFSY
jgi:predicted dehydrogenase